jgi:protoheme IX farnesyltransferase
LALLAAAMLPTILGFAGVSYFIVAAVLGLLLLGSAIRLAVAPQTAGAARRVVLASLIYLPVLLLAMVLDKV